MKSDTKPQTQEAQTILSKAIVKTLPILTTFKLQKIRDKNINEEVRDKNKTKQKTPYLWRSKDNNHSQLFLMEVQTRKH